jgi:hypothetical protein
MLQFIPIIGDVFKNIFGLVGDHFKSKREIKKAITDNKIRMAQSEQAHNQEWEMKQLDNAGWKDDILFYAFIGLFVWAGFDPTGAEIFFSNLNVLPDWFIKTWFWLIASILGVKKIGDYVPSLMNSIKEIVKK